MLEEEVQKILNIIKYTTVRCVEANEELFAHKILKYIEDGKSEGYTSFFTYKMHSKMVKLIKDNLSLGLTSPSLFIRTIANNIIQKEKK